MDVARGCYGAISRVESFVGRSIVIQDRNSLSGQTSDVTELADDRYPPVREQARMIDSHARDGRKAPAGREALIERTVEKQSADAVRCAVETTRGDELFRRFCWAMARPTSPGSKLSSGVPSGFNRPPPTMIFPSLCRNETCPPRRRLKAGILGAIRVQATRDRITEGCGPRAGRLQGAAAWKAPFPCNPARRTCFRLSGA